jgi:pseudaminic acid biosynthesis-associated methylase
MSLMSNEDLWAGEFGTLYTIRNEAFPYERRDSFFKDLISKYQIGSVLEVGCNMGMNIAMISGYLSSPWNTWGIDINKRNIHDMRKRWPDVQSIHGSGFDLPFRDDYFDLVFTSGVLIHQKPSEVERMMQEVIRVSGKYVMAIEYWNEMFIEMKDYRGGRETLYGGPYGDIYEKRYGLKLLEEKNLLKDQGWDNCEMWILEKYA